MIADLFAMADSFINRQKQKEHGYNTRQCLRMFGVSDSGYYAWKGRKEDRSGKQAQKRAERDELKEKMRQIIIRRNGIIPGKRTFRIELFRINHLTVNTKRIAALMKEMNLVAQRPHKDAYKHQASHNHVCAAPPNAVNQNFFIGARKVILTDVTYLYYGSTRNVFYLCVFRDAFTRENLGWEIRTSMKVELIKGAYNQMLKGYENSFAGSSVYIHHDQGSQYLSTSFTQLLEDDGFVQSVSARGNSQDNAPMESFFSRLKTDILDMVARCNSFDAARQLVDGYLKAYNKEHYQYELAGLTPVEFYQYATTGIYPLENYFGVSASEMMAVGDISRVRRAYANEEAGKRREASAKRREEKRLVDPERIIKRDQSLLNRMIDQWEKMKDTAQTQVNHLKNILEQTKTAMEFIRNMSAETLKELTEPLAWRQYEELSYVFAMNELF
jgi:transposase InsO family protein